jgi:hypothetical protein
MLVLTGFLFMFLVAQVTSSGLTAKANPPLAGASPAATDAHADGENFSLIWITDTQYLSQNHPTYFTSLCQWIANHASTYNVKMVVHTGDLVDTESNQTQWSNANTAMSVLLNAGIPYTWDAGNHDYNATCWIGNQYAAFDPSVMAQKSYWVGDASSGKSTAVHLEVDGEDFLVVNLAFQADDAALSWANNLLDSYPQSHAIVATHFYLNRTGGYEDWASNFRRSVLATHSNVFLTLSAHVYSSTFKGIRTQVGDRYELVFNRQDKDSEMGAASLRILTFNLAAGTIDVKTFYIYSNMFLTDENNQFTLNTMFRNDLAASENTEIPELSATAILALAATLMAVVCICKVKARKNLFSLERLI